MLFTCCQTKPEIVVENQFQKHTQFDIEPCLLHRKKVEFVCNDKTCQQNNNTLLCHQCLKQHRNHDWKTKQQYFTRSFKSIVDKRLNLNIKQVLEELQESFQIQLNKSVIDVFNDGVKNVLRELEASAYETELEYSDKIDKKQSQKLINVQNFQEMKEMYTEEKQQIGRIRQISEILSNSLKHVGASIKKMIELLHLQVQVKTWLNHEAMMKFQDQIEHYDMSSKIIQEEKNYFYFSPLLKHDNIKIQSNNKAIYHYSMPSKPVAMTANSLVANHNKFGFQIIKMESKALIFQCTTIFIGVCDEEIVKIAGMRKINEQSKGSYLISSAGWSYHHKDDNYNRADNVGWTFGEGDKIQVQVVFDKHSRSTLKTKIIFKKIGRFFDNVFQMPLKLKNQQIRKLKPCVSFDAQIGAIVKIYDIQ